MTLPATEVNLRLGLRPYMTKTDAQAGATTTVPTMRRNRRQHTEIDEIFQFFQILVILGVLALISIFFRRHEFGGIWGWRSFLKD